MGKLYNSWQKKLVFDDVKKAVYFGLSIDPTPDLSHSYQVTVILRYDSPESGIPIERLTTFLQVENHTGAALAKSVVEYLTEECGVDFRNCCGQSYDNAANMSGKYNGMQQKILKTNKYAKFFPCAKYSLDLFGRAAVDCCLVAVSFFNLVQEIYVFFSLLTTRWEILLSYLKPGCKVPKPLSETTRAAHFKAVSAVNKNLESIIGALDYISENEKGAIRLQADAIAQIINRLEFVFMLLFWSLVLEEFHKTSQALQDSHICLSTCARLYASLSEFVSVTRTSFDATEERAKLRLLRVNFHLERRRGVDGDAVRDLTPKISFV